MLYGLNVPWQRTILPIGVPKKQETIRYGDVRGRNYWKRVGTGPTWTHYGYQWNGRRDLRMELVYCKEHRRREILPENMLYHIGSCWYDRGWHPRFSIRAIILAAMPNAYFGEQTAMESTVRERFFKKAKRRPQPAEIRAFVKANCLVTLYHQRRRHRVTQEFLSKFRKECFTADDFFLENNQERRRLMLRRGVKLDQVLRRLYVVDSDGEGTLYSERANPQNQGGEGYLYVRCPSTNQEYLLQVPLGENRNNTGVVQTQRPWENRVWHPFTPSEARRWTFQLPADAEFTKEA